MMSVLQRQFQRRLLTWLARRQPATATVLLVQKLLFVFPTRFGFGVLALVLLLYVLGTNYQNNLIMLLAYLLLVTVLGAIILAFRNLHHCRLSAQPLSDVYAGDSVLLRISLIRAGLPQALDAGWLTDRQAPALLPVEAPDFVLALPAPRRGHWQIPRLKLQSEYPLGLVRCWCYPQLDCRYWVFPRPAVAAGDASLQPPDAGSADEWTGQRPYQPGDALRQLDWKRFSRQQQLLVQQYHDPVPLTTELWLSPDPRLATLEAQLSDLTAKALLLSDDGQPFGLKLAGQMVPIGSGPAHLRQILQVLALC